MTVSELIQELQAMPQDATVVYEARSEPNVLSPGDIRLIKAEDKAMVIHNDQHICWHRQMAEWYPPGTEPQFVTVVHFPGN